MYDLAATREQLRDFDRRVSALATRARAAAKGDPVTAEAIEGLSTALEELRVTEEELHVQNEELRQTGLELEVERHRYRQLFELAPDAYLVTDEAGVILEANAAAARLLATRVQRLVRKPLIVFILPAERRGFRQELARRVDSQEEWEVTIHPTVGGPVPVACTVVTGHDESLGAPTLLWLIRDVSARKEAEERDRELMREQARHEVRRYLGEVSDVLSSSLDYQGTVQRIAELACRALADYAVVHVEEDGEIRGVAHAASAPGDEESLGRLMRAVPRDAGPDHPIVAALRRAEPVLLSTLPEERMRELAGDDDRLALLRTLQVGCLLVVPLGAAGRTLGVITLARRAGGCPFDDGEQWLARELASRAAHAVENARLYREAQRAALVQEETIGVVSHDLRNALNAALTNADLLLDIIPAFESGSASRRQMEAVRRSLDHMQRLVQDLLEVDRIDRGRLSVHPEPLIPASLVEELNGWLGPVAQVAGLHWEVDIPDNLPPIRADHARLLQVFANLVGNAVNATPPGGRVGIRAERSGEEICFHVGDSGAGIDPESLPRIFDRFFQASDRGRSGSGLGLTISRGLVEAQGGRMWATSRLGEGSTFSFSLPLSD